MKENKKKMNRKMNENGVLAVFVISSLITIILAFLIGSAIRQDFLQISQFSSSEPSLLGSGIIPGLLGGWVFGLVFYFLFARTDETIQTIGIITLLIFALIGAFAGASYGTLQYKLYQLQHPTPPAPPPTYSGVVEAIYNNSPSYVEFTSGDQFYGNLSKISNLSVGSVCELVLNNNETMWFINGTCEAVK